MTKKRIVQVTALDSTMNSLIDRLNKESIIEGHEVHVACTVGHYRAQLESKGLIVHDVKIDREINMKSNIQSILKLTKLFKKIKPDIVHVHTPIASVLGRIAAKLASVPTVIYTAHGFYFHENMKRSKYMLFYYIEKYIGRFFTDYIFSQSKEDYRLAKNFKFLNNNNNYLYIGNGIDLDEKYNYNNINQRNIDRLRDKYHINQENLIVSFVGRFVKEKGILDFLNSYKYLENQNIKFFVIGNLPKSERDQGTINIIKNIHNINIHFTGNVENLEEFLYISDIFCLPSYREGMPRSIIEAMAMKNAVIATNIRGSREEVIHEKTGFLVKLNSSKEIAKKIDELYENPKKLRTFQEAGFKRAHELYNEATVVKKQLDVFDKL